MNLIEKRTYRGYDDVRVEIRIEVDGYASDADVLMEHLFTAIGEADSALTQINAVEEERRLEAESQESDDG